MSVAGPAAPRLDRVALPPSPFRSIQLALGDRGVRPLAIGLVAPVGRSLRRREHRLDRQADGHGRHVARGRAQPHDGKQKREEDGDGGGRLLAA